MRRRRGFSLVEALTSLLLIALVLGVVGGMMGEYARVTRLTAARENATQALQVAMDRMLGEARGAVEWIEPPLGDTSPYPRLTFRGFNPDNDAVRLPTPVPDPHPATWDPFPPASRMEVSYFVQQGQLCRQVTPDAGSPFASPLAEGLAGIRARFLPTGNLEITVSTLDGSRVLTRASEVRCQIP